MSHSTSPAILGGYVHLTRSQVEQAVADRLILVVASAWPDSASSVQLSVYCPGLDIDDVLEELWDGLSNAFHGTTGQRLQPNRIKDVLIVGASVVVQLSQSWVHLRQTVADILGAIPANMRRYASNRGRVLHVMQSHEQLCIVPWSYRDLERPEFEFTFPSPLTRDSMLWAYPRENFATEIRAELHLLSLNAEARVFVGDDELQVYVTVHRGEDFDDDLCLAVVYKVLDMVRERTGNRNLRLVPATPPHQLVGGPARGCLSC
jgi:hypothetical protein